jgi:PAS domain S-box-containing protein
MTRGEGSEDLRRLVDLRHALDNAAIVAATDVTGRITYANDRLCEISGYSRDELLGQDHRLVNSGYHSKEFILGAATSGTARFETAEKTASTTGAIRRSCRS